MCSGEFIVLEGTTDKFLWDTLQKNADFKYQLRIANHRDCSGNKDYVIQVISISIQRGYKNIYGIVDQDYDFLIDNKVKLQNLFFYRYSDLEITLLINECFDAVNQAISSNQKKKTSSDIIQLLLNCTYPLGLLRLINTKVNSYNFCFDTIDYKKLITDDGKAVSAPTFFDYFCSHFHLRSDMKEKLRAEYETFMKMEIPQEKVCNGHDALEVLSLSTKKIISNDNPIKYKPDVLYNMLVLSFCKNDNIKKLDLYNFSELIFQCESA